MKTRQIIKGYYLATPIFLLLEIVFGLDIRVSSFISDPGWRIVYYIFCFVCMGIVLWKPRFTVEVGVLESSVNLIFLFVGAALTWMFPFTTISPENDEVILKHDPVTFMGIVNFLLLGTVWIICFRRWVALHQRSRVGRA